MAYLGRYTHKTAIANHRLVDCTGKKVFWFFHERMECSPDVAAIIRAIVTHEDSLPQGSPWTP